jgi:ribosomal protein L11 methyltransferase
MTRAKDFILHISYDAADAVLDELVQSRLFLTRGTGSTVRETGGTITISAYFDSARDRDEAAQAFDDLSVELGVGDAERLDWLDLYQQSLTPLLIGDRFIVAPDAALIDRRDRLSIIVPQEQAFGTGSHESTALCLEMLERIDLRGKSGLDIGTGSGILAIAMLRLGARKAIALDYDLDTYGALRENRNRNAIAPATMPVFIGSTEALRAGTFDVVTMNILPEVIVALLPEVIRHVRGDLIVSGVLTQMRHEVTGAAAEHGLHLADERKKGEWWCGRLVVTKR